MASECPKSLVITGVSSGIGYAMSKYFVERGFVVFGSVRDTGTGSRIREELGDRFHPLLFDVCDKRAVLEGRDIVREHLSGTPVTALVNNAGLALFGPVELIDDNAFAHVLTVSVMGTRNVTNAFLPLLRAPNDRAARAGKIINISSLSGILNTPMNGAYCISKHALESLGETYRRELKADAIDVVSIRSGPIQSEIWAKNLIEAPDYANEAYNEMSRNAQTIMSSAQASALPADVIAQLVLGIVEGRRRRTSYALGAGAFMARLLASDLMPARLADWLIDRKLRPN